MLILVVGSYVKKFLKEDKSTNNACLLSQSILIPFTFVLVEHAIGNAVMLIFKLNSDYMYQSHMSS